MTAAEVEKKDVEVKKEEEEEDDDEEVPALEEAGAAGADGEQVPGGKKTRSEKKSRKAMARFGLKPVSGCIRVAIKKSKSVLFVIPEPEVYKSPSANTYVIFGEAKMEDIAGEKEKEMVKAFAAAAKEREKVETKAPEDEEEDDEEVDAEGIDAKDIELLMQQAQVKRSQAIAALKKSGGDIVSAVMECQQ
eukprot:TRINITY_DN285_c0_g1_i1.p1 TRINITY_DN285_c0_g1~~TRINITY_DN285_c0_g1_i1.p1  ORF type:complete len:211 (+),score=121.39 TRINITY_DN285_c0_g1_i1:61-633(+)